MSTVFSESNEVLQSLWKDHNPEEEEYLEKEKVIQWIKASLQKTNSLSSFEESLTDLEGLIRQYLAEVHEVTEENTQNISLSYAEGVDFLRWLTNTGEEAKQKEQGEQQRENAEQIDKNINIANNSSSTHQKVEKQQQYLHQNNEQQQENNETNRIEQSNEPIDRPQQRIQDNPSNHSYNFKKHKPQHHDPPQNALEPQKQYQKNDQNFTNNPNQFNIDHLTRKYKDYLKIIFQHYCKLTYSTGQDPTFQQIMHKTTIMTITKFMMFCKDFQIAKYHSTINRSFLIEIFKKNSECYKEMSYEQFCDVMKKLSEIGVESKQVEGNEEEKQLLPSEMVKFLEFCEMDTSKKFREKMKKLNIAYRAGPKTNAQLKVVPDGYRFKFTSNNGKSEEQIKQELNERKINRSERRLFLQEKVNMSQNDLSLNKRVIKKNELNLSKQSKPIKQTKAQSTQIINKILTPIILPAKKPNQLPPPPPKTITTPVQSRQANSTHNNNSSNSSSNANLFKKQLGYAEMHKIKQTEGYSRKRAITNSNSRSQNGKGTFKLNSIVEQARQQVLDAQIPHQGHTQNLSESIATNSREQSQRVKAYDVSKINNRMQQISDKIKRDRQIQQQLNGLIDIQNDEQDEYLMEHLERQKKNESIVKRLSHRINELDVIK